MFLNVSQPKTEISTVMKVKIFISHSLDEVENEVNEWMDQSYIRIRHVTQSQCEKQGKFVFVISLFYETAANK
jgi:hypothetical protein